jgi:hypothetical protein
MLKSGLAATTITACWGLLQNAVPICVAVTVNVPVCVDVHVFEMLEPVDVMAGDVLIFQLKLPGGTVPNAELQLTQLVLGPKIL